MPIITNSYFHILFYIILIDFKTADIESSEDNELNYIIMADFIRVIPQKVDVSNRNDDNNSINDNGPLSIFLFNTYVFSFIALK